MLLKAGWKHLQLHCKQHVFKFKVAWMLMFSLLTFVLSVTCVFSLCWEQHFSVRGHAEAESMSFRHITFSFFFFFWYCSSQAKLTEMDTSETQNQHKITPNHQKNSSALPLWWQLWCLFMWQKSGSCYFRKLWELWPLVATVPIWWKSFLHRQKYIEFSVKEPKLTFYRNTKFVMHSLWGIYIACVCKQTIVAVTK